VINGDEKFFKNAFDLGIKSGLKFLKKEYINKIKIILHQIDEFHNNNLKNKIDDINIELNNIDNQINENCLVKQDDLHEKNIIIRFI
jgi:recombination DNA repair RAD52 pathway protein